MANDQVIPFRNVGKDGKPTARFWSKVQKTETCWIWTAYRTPNGYGTLSVGATTKLAHRIAYMGVKGPIPDGLVLDHLCRNPSCVNPDHLEPVTTQENTKRGIGHPNKRKTHCKRGHEFTPDNIIYKPNGARRCATCCSMYTILYPRDYSRRNRRKKSVTPTTPQPD